MTSTTPSYTQQVKSLEEYRKANQLHDELRQMLFEGHCPRRLHQNVRLLLEAYERALEGGKGVSPAGFLLLGNIWLSQIRDHMAEQNHEQGIQENIHALIMERAKSRLLRSPGRPASLQGMPAPIAAHSCNFLPREIHSGHPARRARHGDWPGRSSCASQRVSPCFWRARNWRPDNAAQHRPPKRGSRKTS